MCLKVILRALYIVGMTHFVMYGFLVSTYLNHKLGTWNAQYMYIKAVRTLSSPEDDFNLNISK